MGTIRSGLARPSFSIATLTSTVGVSHSALAHGLGTVANQAPLSFVQGVGVGRTERVLRSGSGDMARITTALKCFGQGCFAAYFGRRFKVAPDRFRGSRRRRWASSYPLVITGEKCGYIGL